jgi:hypothetical protein
MLSLSLTTRQAAIEKTAACGELTLELQSGCRLEQLQLERADHLERALATYAIVAWRLLWLTYEARSHLTESIEGILPAHYWQALYCHIYQTRVLPPSR